MYCDGQVFYELDVGRQFFHFYVIQLFSAKAEICRNSNFVLTHENMKKKTLYKIGYLDKTAEIFNIAKCAQSAAEISHRFLNVYYTC